MHNATRQSLNKESYSQNLLSVISEYFSKEKQCCIFLDVDGTLSEFHIDPLKSFIPKTTLCTLCQLKDLDIPVIAITGRSVQVASHLFSPLQLPIAGTHGLEIDMQPFGKLNADINKRHIALIQQDTQKTCLAKKIAHDIQSRHSEFKINEGKYVFELIPVAADKGQAIQKILNHLNFTNVLPIFIGDDKTDESGFEVVNHYHGISIKVGEEETEACYRLKNVADVANFLDLFLQFFKTHFSRHSEVSHGEKACLN